MKRWSFVIFGLRFSFNAGWYSGENWRLLKIDIGEYCLGSLFLLDITILKASIFIDVEKD